MSGQPLPVCVPPQVGESIESWLEHLADANGLPTATLLRLIRNGRGAASTRYLTLAPSPQAVARITELARVPAHQVRAASLARFDGTAIDLTGLDPDDRHSYRQVGARGWTPAHGTQICPTCLHENGAWRGAWRLLVTTACPTHQTYLVTRCPSCRRPFRDQHHSHLRAVGSATVCGNPLGAGPTRQCDQDLTTVTTNPAPAAVLAMQDRVDTALAQEHVDVLGEQVSGSAYLADLRHLTTLVLHLAGQPGADQLADWTHDLKSEADQRGTRRGARWGARWGLRPPDEPHLRGRALATADRILSATTLDEAVTAVVPWVELTPVTVDGALGWLADRTVMTPTLARLVFAARAPHRRLSHHLDTLSQPTNSGKGAVMTWSLNAIPQVMPHEIYINHLDGAFDSSEDTVRLFASLTLARVHPDMTSWTAAAETLGMPAAMGVRNARACSATMRVSADEWSSRTLSVAPDIRRIDYRALEAKVRHRTHLFQWFDEWVRVNRPGTRIETQPLALTWQWVHVAHGHLYLSPAWQGAIPTPSDRTRYRQFEASLDDRQQLTLAYALHQRA